MPYPTFNAQPGSPRLETAIRIASPEQLGKLMRKLTQYQANLDKLSGVSDMTVARFMGFYAIGAITSKDCYVPLRKGFKHAILAFVLDTASTYDITDRPVLIPEVGRHVTASTGIDVNAAAAEPFDYYPEQDRYAPNLQRVRARTNEAGQAFVDAYEVIRVYAEGRPDLTIGGTHLPDIPPLFRRRG